MGEKQKEDKEGSGACSDSYVFCAAYYTPGGLRALIINQRAAGKSQEMQTQALARKMWVEVKFASLEPVKGYTLFAEFICFTAEFPAFQPLRVLSFLFSGLMAASLSGVEAEAEVCCLEEAALVHRRGEPGAAGLPAGGPQLAGSLLVQVCAEPGMFILCLFCP